MTRILFYAPLKPPTHPVPSGDRTMARLLLLALRQAGFDVMLASRLRARIADPLEPLAQETMRAQAWGIADRLIAKLRAAPKRARPKAVFTYHLYYKAVDWIGPRVAEALDIPYLVAEASHAPKRAAGAWAFNHAGAEAAIAAADAIFCLNPNDKECLAQVTDRRRLVDLPPFLDLQSFAPVVPAHESARAQLAARHKLDGPRDLGRPWLLAVGMMRKGDKLASYQVLAEALRRAKLARPLLLIIGAGEAQAEVQRAFRDAPCAVRFLGALPPEQLIGPYAASDLLVWPAINEAFGMALLEAQACGLPVLAGASGGVPAIVADGKTGFLTPPGDAAKFAAGLKRALKSDLPKLGKAARAKVARRHDLPAAAANLARGLAKLGVKP
ncbi:MAG TPA: glycosyltransferase family 4 protein [Dongiaceae bacterium]|nr:glycosyltransferase family 4 protein [Dongiaceae bacterium]